MSGEPRIRWREACVLKFLLLQGAVELEFLA
jgi:hypothetical protein